MHSRLVRRPSDNKPAVVPNLANRCRSRAKLEVGLLEDEQLSERLGEV
jgi:hypothetical protein